MASFTLEQRVQLSYFYFKNVVLMKIAGRMTGPFLESRQKEWDVLRASVAGQDTWLVVGNGPSLSAEDLEALKSLPSVASNKINLLFSKTTWRPTFYTIGDPLLLHKLPAEHYEDFPLTLLPHTHVFMSKARRQLPWRHIQDAVGEAKYLKGDEELEPLNGLLIAATVTCPNLALAMWAGAKTIYLIGCDHFYSNEDHKDGSKRTEHQGPSNHFDPNYRKPGELVNAAPVEWMNRGYALLRKIAEKRGVTIINISRKTALEAFECGNADDVIAQVRAKNNP